MLQLWSLCIQSVTDNIYFHCIKTQTFVSNILCYIPQKSIDRGHAWIYTLKETQVSHWHFQTIKHTSSCHSCNLPCFTENLAGYQKCNLYRQNAQKHTYGGALANSCTEQPQMFWCFHNASWEKAFGHKICSTWEIQGENENSKI